MEWSVRVTFTKNVLKSKLIFRWVLWHNTVWNRKNLFGLKGNNGVFGYFLGLQVLHYLNKVYVYHSDTEVQPDVMVFGSLAINGPKWQVTCHLSMDTYQMEYMETRPTPPLLTPLTTTYPMPIPTPFPSTPINELRTYGPIFNNVKWNCCLCFRGFMPIRFSTHYFMCAHIPTLYLQGRMYNPI